MSSPAPTTWLDRIALIITGVFLGGFAIAAIILLLIAERSSEGSWWNLAAYWISFVTGAAVFVVGALLLARVGWLSTTQQRRRDTFIRLALALAGGAVGGIVMAVLRPDVPSLRAGAIHGMVSALSLLFSLWLLGLVTPPRDPRREPAPTRSNNDA